MAEETVYVHTFIKADGHELTADPGSSLDEILRADPDYTLVSEGMPRPPEPRVVHWFTGPAPRPGTHIEAPL